MEYDRQLKYYYLRFVRLRGEPHELALGIAFGVFSGMMPIMPFQIALAVALAIFFKASKITAALGTWVSNPLNWYFLYLYSFKIGVWILGLSEKKQVLYSIIASLKQGEEMSVVIGKMFATGGITVVASLIGGLLMGIVASVAAYFVFLKIFQAIRRFRRSGKHRIIWWKRRKLKK